jgi:hypothetical protein
MGLRSRAAAARSIAPPSAAAAGRAGASTQASTEIAVSKVRRGMVCRYYPGFPLIPTLRGKPWTQYGGAPIRRTRRALLTCAAAVALLIGTGARAPPTWATSPLDGDSMWIWVVAKSSRGNPAAIVGRARRYGVEAVVVKGADGRTPWGQFTPSFVSRLKAAGLRVCAYQFVYGRRPRTEAIVGARLARTGADCLMIDAESAYEGRYAQAQTYLRVLRARVGPDYPLGLAGFPYVHYHPAFPYSVFLGPGGAQLNVPQIYWKAIGTTVDRAY